MEPLSVTRANTREYLKSHRGRLLLVFLVYLALVIYGSLVTRQFVSGLSIDQALEHFSNISYRQLSADRRQDLLANLVLYVPFGFLACALIWPVRRILSLQLLGSVAVAIAGFGLAVAVEFAQLWFKRTVSLNDLYAEVSGVLIGIVLWWSFGEKLATHFFRMFKGRVQALKSILLLYVIAYILLSLFPYDFAINIDELRAKWGGSPFSIVGQCRTTSWCIIKPAIEFLLAIPVGLLFIVATGSRPGIFRLLGYGLLFGLGLECIQALTISGRSSYLSVLIRGLAFVAASGLFHSWSHFVRLWFLILPRVRTLVVALSVPYLLLLFSVNGIFELSFAGFDALGGKLGQTRFIPFYYHYFNSETEALISVLAQLGMYAPVGLAIWAWGLPASKPGSIAGRSIWALILGLFLGAAVWLGRSVFSSTPFADPTNIWLAALFSVFAFVVASKLQSWFETPQEYLESAGEFDDSSPIKADVAFNIPESSRISGYFGVLLIALGALAWANITYPLILLLLVVLAMGVIARRPEAWLLFVPIVIPIVDLGVLSGAHWFDELDAFLLLVAGGLYLKQKPHPLNWMALGHIKWALLLLMLSTLTAMVLGLAKLVEISDFNQVMLQLNPANTLYLARGLFYPVLFLPLIYSTLKRSRAAIDLFVIGMLSAIFLVIGLVLIERHLFAGLLDFNSHYRVSAHFSSMNVGGQHIDAFLLLGSPFALGWFLFHHRRTAILAIVPLLLLLFYVVFVTYSRWTLAAFLIQVVAMMAGFAWLMKKITLPKRLMVFCLSALVVLGGVAAVLFENNYMKTRLAVLDRDAETRVNHWQDAINLGSHGGGSALTGAGLGTFSALNLDSMPASQRPGQVILEDEGLNHYLRLKGGGLTLYAGQFIEDPESDNLAFMLDTRGVDDQSYKFFVKICENSLMYSLGCSSWAVEGQGQQWQTHLFYINPWQGRYAPEKNDGWLKPPLFFSLVTPGFGVEAEIDNLSLVGAKGVELLNNPDFSAGSSHWLLLSDDHLLWHVKNIAAHFFFEQGVLGILGFAWLLLAALYPVIRYGSANPGLALVFTASVAGFLMIGLSGSLVDAPRLMLLFYFILLTGTCYFSPDIEAQSRSQSNG